MTKKILQSESTNEEVIKKSLFIGVCSPINSSDDFFQFLSKHQDLNATHNCWAYRIGNEYRFNDDGEPSGTAGKPILAAIDGADFDQIGALVIRYYGGIKLGTGGLARAYGGTIAKNLNDAPFEFFIAKKQLATEIDFQYSQALHQVLELFDGVSLKQDFTESGISSVVELPDANLQRFKTKLKNLTKGTASIKSI